MLFVTVLSLPSFITFSKGILPRLKPRQVPLSQWALQVTVLTTGSLLNNWAFAYNVPLTILIVFRSAGGCSWLYFVTLPEKAIWDCRVASVDATWLQRSEETIFFSPSCELYEISAACLPLNMFTLFQLAIMLVTAGVTLVTLSKSSGSTSSAKTLTAEETTKYFIGIGMMSISLFCTGLLGLLQERTYTKYGPCWREGVFYTVSL
jgi:UDP-xylose/UDP-N-acetylglucosamine transporter B4